MSARNTGRAAPARAELKRSFSGASVGLKLMGGPINPSNPAIVQMNIQPSRRFGDYIQIWPGHPDNEIEVLSSDRRLVQLVLRVKEPRRPFVETVSRWRGRSREAVEMRVHANGGRILAETRDGWRLQLWTPEVARLFLCGRDDLRLFIAHVREGRTVAEAHAALMPDEARRLEELRPGSVLRQGEWFFLPASDEETERLLQQIQERTRAVRLGAPVGQGGRPHRADRVVHVDRRHRTRHREYRWRETYARGAVLHPDHRPLWLPEWRKVVRNRELGGGNALRMKWID